MLNFSFEDLEHVREIQHRIHTCIKACTHSLKAPLQEEDVKGIAGNPYESLCLSMLPFHMYDSFENTSISISTSKDH